MENSMNITPNIKFFAFLSSSRNKVTRNNKQLLRSNKIYVQSVPPLTSYMFGVAVFLLLPEIFSMLLFLIITVSPSITI